MKIKFKSIDKLSLYTLEKLNKLIIHSYSHLASLVYYSYSSYILSRYKTKINLEAYCSVAIIDKEIIGWAAASKEQDSNIFHLSVFVKEDYRNNKIGTKLYNNLTKNIKKKYKEVIFLYSPVDKIGKQFFKKVKND